jgi:NAD(P)-dependent dehydrogenase (short-subunit alcohol dehydrogenase family)
VTGGGRGIGAAISRALAAAGAAVIVNDTGVAVDGTAQSTEAADAVVADIRSVGGVAHGSYSDVSSHDGGRAAIESAVARYGRIDVLVCCAGILRPATIFDMTADDWEAVLSTNLTGHFTVMRAASEYMRRSRSGTIVTCTSSGGLEGNPLQPNYSAAKEGIIGLTRAVALSLAPYATCNAIAPSAATRMTDLMLPPGRAGTAPDPSAVGPLAVYLASDRARHITGQVIAAGGPRLAIYPQPRPVTATFSRDGWTAEAIADEWDRTLRADPMIRLERYLAPDAALRDPRLLALSQEHPGLPPDPPPTEEPLP